MFYIIYIIKCHEFISTHNDKDNDIYVYPYLAIFNILTFSKQYLICVRAKCQAPGPETTVEPRQPRWPRRWVAHGKGAAGALGALGRWSAASQMTQKAMPKDLDLSVWTGKMG